MLNDDDRQNLMQRGISEEEFNAQLMQFRTGFPFMKVEKPAVASDGILCLMIKTSCYTCQNGLNI